MAELRDVRLKGDYRGGVAVFCMTCETPETRGTAIIEPKPLQICYVDPSDFYQLEIVYKAVKQHVHREKGAQPAEPSPNESELWVRFSCKLCGYQWSMSGKTLDQTIKRVLDSNCEGIPGIYHRLTMGEITLREMPVNLN